MQGQQQHVEMTLDIIHLVIFPGSEGHLRVKTSPAVPHAAHDHDDVTDGKAEDSNEAEKDLEHPLASKSPPSHGQLPRAGSPGGHEVDGRLQRLRGTSMVDSAKAARRAIVRARGVVGGRGGV